MLAFAASGLILLCSPFVVNGEWWSQVDEHVFNAPQSALRRQGLASDEEQRFYFSSFHSLVRVPSVYSEEVDALNLFAISPELKSLGDNHIGGIDYFNGTLYAPIEDGPEFQHPVVAMYDAQSLKSIRVELLSPVEQPDGLPWLCLDPPRGVLYSSKYSNASKVNAYSLETFQFAYSVPLAESVDSIQGGKMYNGSLYLTASRTGVSDAFSVYKVDLQASSVTEVAQLQQDTREIEGVAFADTDGDGKVEMYILAIRIIDNPIANKLAIRIAEVVRLDLQE